MLIFSFSSQNNSASVCSLLGHRGSRAAEGFSVLLRAMPGDPSATSCPRTQPPAPARGSLHADIALSTALTGQWHCICTAWHRWKLEKCIGITAPAGAAGEQPWQGKAGVWDAKGKKHMALCFSPRGPCPLPQPPSLTLLSPAHIQKSSRDYEGCSGSNASYVIT